jgi:Mg2+ and Co2+ transporter CorA
MNKKIETVNDYLYITRSRVITYLKFRRKYSYNDLCRELFGNGEYEKGLRREYRFLVEVIGSWRSSFELAVEYNKKLKKEIEELENQLRELNGSK